ncbi:MAG: SIS domain-containing protein [Bacteroidota bacterium]|nr:SIS domain-containing protein [Bacteroidota bacterium]
MAKNVYKLIENAIGDSSSVFQAILNDSKLCKKIQLASEKCIKAYNNNNKLLFCGNGGSASDAQHIAAELSGRFYVDRAPLNAQALHVNTSYLTAVANDYGYKKVYSRMLEATGNKGDILFGISTSGRSENILEAIKQAKQMGVFTIGLTGIDGGELKSLCDLVINIPSSNTARIQEAHILIGHIICESIERELF